MNPNRLVLDHIPLTVRKRLFDIGKLQVYKKGATIFRVQEEVQHIYFVVEGYVSLFRDSKQGEKKVIFICAPSEVLNEVILERPVSSITAKALTETTLLKVKRQDLSQLMKEEYELSTMMFKSLSQKTRRLYHQATNFHGNYSLEARLASKVWKLMKDHGYQCSMGTMLRFDVSVTFLANLLGAKRESVSRILSVWKKEGIIIHKDNRLIVPDMQVLSDMVK